MLVTSIFSFSHYVFLRTRTSSRLYPFLNNRLQMRSISKKLFFFSFGKGFTKQEVYCRYNVYGLQVLPAHVFITSVQSKQTRNALINQTDITPVCCFNLKVGFRFNDDYCIYLLENGQIYCERCRISVGLFRCHGLMMNR